MLKLNTHRTFTAAVAVHSVTEDGKPAKGTFTATFKVMPSTTVFTEENADKRLLDMVLVSVDETELDIRDQDDRKLTGIELLEALKADPSISNAMITTYSDTVAKKNQKRI